MKKERVLRVGYVPEAFAFHFPTSLILSGTPKSDETTRTVIRDNHFCGSVGDFLKPHLKTGTKLSVVSAYFTIYAYQALKAE